MCKYKLLKGVDLILEGHEIGNGFVSSPKSEVIQTNEPLRTYPSFGSLIDLRLMYSSYSNSPGEWISAGLKPGHHFCCTVELWVLSMESKLGHEEVDIVAQ